MVADRRPDQAGTAGPCGVWAGGTPAVPWPQDSSRGAIDGQPPPRAVQVNNSVAEAAGRGEKLEQQQRAMLGSTSELAAQANETMTLLQALAEEVGSAKVRAPQALPCNPP